MQYPFPRHIGRSLQNHDPIQSVDDYDVYGDRRDDDLMIVHPEVFEDGFAYYGSTGDAGGNPKLRVADAEARMVPLHVQCVFRALYEEKNK